MQDVLGKEVVSSPALPQQHEYHKATVALS